jgi:hypothetical protein
MGLLDSRELIIEQRLEQATILEDAPLENGQRRVSFEAIVSEADYINRNGRMYPMNVLWPAFELVRQDLAAYPGAVGHPMDPSFEDIGIMWSDFWMEGNYIKGRGSVVWTAKGSDLAANLEAGVKVGFSTRTYASFEDQTIDGQTVRVAREMDPPYVDAVLTPSVKHATVLSVSKEQLDMELEEKLTAANEAVVAVEAKLVEANESAALIAGELAEAVAASEVAAARALAAEARIVELEAIIAERAEVEAVEALEARLITLTSGHRFAPTIIAEAKKLGVSLETAEMIVNVLTPLVEGAASAHNEEGAPKGDLSTTEDAPIAALPERTPAQEAELYEAHLLTLSAERIVELKGLGLL